MTDDDFSDVRAVQIDDNLAWLPWCANTCALCQQEISECVHICGFHGIGVEETCANLCRHCASRIGGAVP